MEIGMIMIRLQMLPASLSKVLRSHVSLKLSLFFHFTVWDLVVI